MVTGEARFNEEVRVIYSNFLVQRQAQTREAVIMKLIIAGLIEPSRDIAKLSTLLAAIVTSDRYFNELTGGLPTPDNETLKQIVQQRCEQFLKLAAHA